MRISLSSLSLTSARLGVIPALVALFPSETPLSSGGWAPLDGAGNPMTLATVAAQPDAAAATWGIASGRLVATAGSIAGDDGKTLTVTTSLGATLTVLLDCSLLGRAIATTSELTAVIGLAGASQEGRTMVLRCGVNYDITAVSWNNKHRDLTNGIVYKAESPTAKKPHITGSWAFTGSVPIQNVTLDGLSLYVPQSTTYLDLYGGIQGNSSVIVQCAALSKNITVRNCELYSNLTPAIEGGRMFDEVTAVYFEAGDSHTIEDNEIHHVGRGFRTRCSGTIQRNTIHHVFNDFFTVQRFVAADTGWLYIRDNFAHTSMGWYDYLHPDFLQFQPDGSLPIRKVLVEDNVFLPGGTMALSRPGDNTPGGYPQTATKNQVSLPVADANKAIVLDAASHTMTLYDPALAPNTAVWVITNATNVTVRGFDNAVLDNGNGYRGLGFVNDGVTWRKATSGTRAGMVEVKGSHTATARAHNMGYLVDTSGGPATITLSDDAGLTNIKIAQINPGAAVTIVASGDDTISYGGQTVANIVLSTLHQQVRLTKSGNVWTATDTLKSIQGFFGNPQNHNGGYQDCAFRDNVLIVNAVHGWHIEGTLGNTQVTGNVILPMVAPNAETKIAIPQIESDGAGNTMTGNLVGATVFGAGTISGNTALNITPTYGVTSDNALAVMSGYFVGATLADYNPTTIAEAKAALTPKPGGPIDGVSIGGLTSLLARPL